MPRRETSLASTSPRKLGPGRGSNKPPNSLVERLGSYQVGNLALQEVWVGEMHEAAAVIRRLTEEVEMWKALAMPDPQSE
jgi:hypothetical protein